MTKYTPADLRAARRALGHTQAALAELADVTQAYVSHVERRPALRHDATARVRVLRALGLEVQS
jgi:predicted transcriptional regulator